MPNPTKKERSEAIGRARARLEKRTFGNDSWSVVLQYSHDDPNLQMADRATALVLGSILEQGVELSIFSHCVLGWNTPESDAEQKKLFGGSGDGSMGFAVKTRMAYALGVFGPQTRDAFDLIRHIRNLFAHDRGHLTFEDSVVSDLCKQLKWIESYPWGGPGGPKPSSSRGRYVETVRYIFPYLKTRLGKPIKYSTYLVPEMYA